MTSNTFFQSLWIFFLAGSMYFSYRSPPFKFYLLTLVEDTICWPLKAWEGTTTPFPFSRLRVPITKVWPDRSPHPTVVRELDAQTVLTSRFGSFLFLQVNKSLKWSSPGFVYGWPSVDQVWQHCRKSHRNMLCMYPSASDKPSKPSCMCLCVDLGMLC